MSISLCPFNMMLYGQVCFRFLELSLQVSSYLMGKKWSSSAEFTLVETILGHIAQYIPTVHLTSISWWEHIEASLPFYKRILLSFSHIPPTWTPDTLIRCVRTLWWPKNACVHPTVWIPDVQSLSRNNCHFGLRFTLDVHGDVQERMILLTFTPATSSPAKKRQSRLGTKIRSPAYPPYEKYQSRSGPKSEWNP